MFNIKCQIQEKEYHLVRVDQVVGLQTAVLGNIRGFHAGPASHLRRNL